MRTVLLAAVNHDLRTPLAAAKAAVSCLRSHNIQLIAEEHGELLATADESLNQLTQLLASLTANALRYSPGGSPPLLTTSARGRRVILRVVDYGPGVSEADRDRIFAAFQRLGDARSTIGVGLGLTVFRGLTEAMGGTLDPGKLPAAA
jgi:K+-sensing histidine kinase KdpD